jgi:predicted ATPase
MRFVLVSGEPGIGKTRLVEELTQWTDRQRFSTARARCYVAEGQLAYAPLVEWLRSEPIRTRLGALDEVWLIELARLLPDLLVEYPTLPRPQPVSASWQRRTLFEALARAILAADLPLLLVIDDLQWCDQETLEWLHFFLRFDTDARVLVVATARSADIDERRALTSFLFSLRSNGQFTEIDLGPLSSDETAQLAAHIAHRQLTQAQISQLYRNTEGNPLFVVESVRVANWSQATQEDEAPSTPVEPSAAAPSLPPKVFSVIEARLAQLSPPARELVGLAATVGREFSATVLIQASTRSEHEVVEALDELWRRQLVREQGPDRYDFSHDRIRETAYAGLSNARRRLFHRSVAQSLEVVNAGDLDRMAGQVAAHYEQAGLPDQAIPYYRRAAEAAMQLYAYSEAISLFQHGLSLLAKLPASRAKAEQELSFRLGLALPLVVVGGYGASQVWETCNEAQRLLRELGYPENPLIVRALAIWYIAHRNYEKAIEQGKLLLALALQAGAPPDPVLDAEGHYVLGAAAFWQGRFTDARNHLEKVCAEYDVQHHEAHIAQFVQDAGVVCCIRLAYALWFLGYADQAQELCAKALSMAQQMRHPYTTAYALGVASWIADKCRDATRTEQFTDQLLDLCKDYQMDYWMPIGLALKGGILVSRGEEAAGLKRIHAAIDATRSLGQDINRPYMLTKLTNAHARAGRVEQALAALDEALTSVAHHGDHWYEAELYRLKGELLWANGAPASVVAALFEQALDLARCQQAKSLELRAAMSLARLWASQGRRAEARALLAEVVAWFTEGFATADYQEAQTLLAELA